MSSQAPAASVLDEVQFCAWVAQGEAGDTLAYHQGFLAVDLGPLSRTMPEAQRTVLNRMRTRAFSLAQRGFLHLVQHRLAPDQFLYVAIVRPRASAAPVSLATLMSTENG
ncbi:MAG: hypothetical protein ACK4JB_15410 [Reyranella sp.]